MVIEVHGDHDAEEAADGRHADALMDDPAHTDALRSSRGARCEVYRLIGTGPVLCPNPTRSRQPLTVETPAAAEVSTLVEGVHADPGEPAAGYDQNSSQA